jgi:DNA-binding transcriptional LysR family regulator
LSIISPHAALDGVDLKHLRYALMAADLHSFAKAASRLGIKQATLSQHISYLERRIGSTLFRRSPRGVVPTEAGTVFLQSARRVIDELEGLYTKTRFVGQGRAGSVSIGFVASITAGNLRSVLLAFEELYPDVRIRGVEEAPQTLFTKLDTGVVDLLVLAGAAPYSGVARLSLWSEPIYVALPSGHPLASHDRLFWSDLRDETFLAARNTADDIRLLVNSRLARVGCSSLIATEMSRESILSIVAAGRGVTIVSAASTGLKIDGVSYRQLNDGTAPHVQNFSGYWRSDNSNPALKVFLGFLRARYSLASVGT